MPVDELDRVRRANPVPDPPPVPPLERLQRSIKAADARPRRRGAPRAAALVAAVAAAVAVALLAWPSGQPDVLAAVYRATDPGPGTLHMSWTTSRYEAGVLRSTDAIEVWSQPQLSRSRTITRYSDHATGRTRRSEMAVDGPVMRSWSSRRPHVIQEHREPAGTSLGAQDGGIGVMRHLYRSGLLKLAGPASGGRWELRGTLATGTRLVAFVRAGSFSPLEIRLQSDLDGRPGSSLTVTRYTAYRRLRHGPRLGLDLPGHGGLPVQRHGALGGRRR